MRSFSYFAWGLAGLAATVFFSVATLAMVTFGQIAEEKIPQYEKLWTRGWNDFNSISASIRDLTDTTRPLIETFPTLVTQIDEMNDTVQHMDRSVEHLSITVPSQMEYMGYQMGHMQHSMTPGGMMQNMFP